MSTKTFETDKGLWAGTLEMRLCGERRESAELYSALLPESHRETSPQGAQGMGAGKG